MQTLPGARKVVAMGVAAKPGQRFCYLSYAHEDLAYAQRLVTYLREQRIPVWYDQHIENGERWDQVLKRQLGQCAAVVVVMSPAAGRSHWVAVEYIRALNAGVPVLPLLLAGEVLFGLDIVQCEDVTGELMPSPAYVRRLQTVLADGSDALRVDGTHRAYHPRVGADPTAGAQPQARVPAAQAPVPTEQAPVPAELDGDQPPSTLVWMLAWELRAQFDDPHERMELVSRLPPEIISGLAPEAMKLEHWVVLVRTCLARPSAFSELTEAVRVAAAGSRILSMLIAAQSQLSE